MGKGPELIPRRVLFGNPERTSVRISHDGKRISYLAAVDGVLNVWVAPLEAIEDALPITEDTGRGIRVYLWTYNSRFIMYLRDRDGDENWHCHAVNVETGEDLDLTPYDGIQAIPKAGSPRVPDEVLIGINRRDPRLHDLYRVNLLTGSTQLIVENDFGAIDILADRDLIPRLARVQTPEGGASFLTRSESGEWNTTMSVGPEDDLTTSPLYFDAGGSILYMADSRGRDTSALVAIDTETGDKQELAADSNADVADTIVHPVTGIPQAVAFEFERYTWKSLDNSIDADVELLDSRDKGDFRVRSRSMDDLKWLIEYERDDGPKTYYLYKRPTRELDYLFSDRPDLESASLASMNSTIVRSRDGLDLVTYFTLPVGSTDEVSERPSKPLPTVLLVHGGPWGRDSWGYDPEHQLLANRGYAVISVNFRASAGFGKWFANSGNLEWAGAMHDDLIDTVEWATEEGIADSSRVAIMGASYGGYAALVGLTFTPEVFACGIDIVGPSNLNTLLDTVPPYWKPMTAFLRRRVGDNSNEEGRRFLTERSPLSHVGNIVRPLLIGQGANDPRVKQSESDQIVSAMKERGIPVTYVLYSDEGHGFMRPENKMSFVAVAEAFLAKCIGGRYEAVGNDFRDSSIRVLAGSGDIPGLSSSLLLTESETKISTHASTDP